MNAQIKILIIDDDIHVLQSIGITFTTMTHGFLVLTATSANEGLAMIKEQRPDVVVLDVRLGPKSGMDLLKDFDAYFKEPHNRKYKPHFIVITAYRDEMIKKEAENIYHVDAFLIKPFNDTDIRKAVMTSVQKILIAFHDQLCPYSDRPPIGRNESLETKKPIGDASDIGKV
jgi:DNA-binding NtrC family response regulator